MCTQAPLLAHLWVNCFPFIPTHFLEDVNRIKGGRTTGGVAVRALTSNLKLCTLGVEAESWPTSQGLLGAVLPRKVFCNMSPGKHSLKGVFWSSLRGILLRDSESILAHPQVLRMLAMYKAEFPKLSTHSMPVVVLLITHTHLLPPLVLTTMVRGKYNYLHLEDVDIEACERKSKCADWESLAPMPEQGQPLQSILSLEPYCFKKKNYSMNTL